jgi:hypothetical protein
MHAPELRIPQVNLFGQRCIKEVYAVTSLIKCRAKRLQASPNPIHTPALGSGQPITFRLHQNHYFWRLTTLNFKTFALEKHEPATPLLGSEW